MPQNTADGLIDTGSYFTANDGATGISTGATPTSYSDTAPLFTLQNTNTKNNGKSIYLDWLRAYCTAAGTAGVDVRLKMELDVIVPTGGTVLTPNNVNPNDPYVSSGGVPRIMPTGIAATANMRLIVGNQVVMPTQGVVFTVNSEFNVNFGTREGQGSPQWLTAQQGDRTFTSMPPIVIPPGWCLQVPFLMTSQSGASSWAIEIGYVEF